MPTGNQREISARKSLSVAEREEQYYRAAKREWDNAVLNDILMEKDMVNCSEDERKTVMEENYDRINTMAQSVVGFKKQWRDSLIDRYLNKQVPDYYGYERREYRCV